VASREIELTASTIDNGRIYLSTTDRPFFPKDSFGDRKKSGHKGNPVIFRAGAFVFEDHVREYSGTRISPRPDFSKYFKSVGAKVGGRLRITQVGAREYELEYLGP
jgi:hypothetical protein